MIRRIIAIILCLLVIVGTVSCAADKNKENEEEEESDSSSSEDTGIETAHWEAFEEMADCFVQAVFLPNVSLLMGSFHPELLGYMARVDGVSEEALYASAAEANTKITQAWAKLYPKAEFSDLSYEYTIRFPDTTQWDELSIFYAEVPLTPENAVILDISIFYENAAIGTFSLSLVLIDGIWWADPILTTSKSAIS